MTRLYSENDHYVATITSQEFCKTPEQYGAKPQLMVKVKLTSKAKVNNDVKMEHGSEELPESLHNIRTIYLDLAHDSKNLIKTKRILAQLGFVLTDPKLLARLHPQHPKSFTLVGKKALVRVWYKEKTSADGTTSERDNWYFVDDRPVESFDLSEFEELLRSNEEAYSNATE